MPRALFASKTLGTALVQLPSGPCYGRILPPRADTPADHLRVDLAGIVHLVPAPFASRPISTDERPPVGVVPGGTRAPSLTMADGHVTETDVRDVLAPEVARLDRVLGPLRTMGVGR